MSYLETTKEFYKEAALKPDIGLCCTTSPIWQLPELQIPGVMLEMNYGCGSTIHPRDLSNNPKILYVGVGGGMELLQFAYFSRIQGHVIGIDPVEEMLQACINNFKQAEELNSWFSSDYIQLKRGDALNLPVEDQSVDVAAQNCLFNIFKKNDLRSALGEVYRVLKPGGKFISSDPICNAEMPDSLREDEQLRAACLSGSISLDDYLKTMTDTGFGTIEVRAKRPYRVIDPGHFNTDKLIYIESVEICAIKDPMPDDGPCIFTGRTAVYFGNKKVFDDGKGHVLPYNQPLAVCDKTANALINLERKDILVTDSTWFYDGGGCC